MSGESRRAADRRHLFDRAQNVRRVLRGLYALCGLSLLLEFFVHRHVDHPWEALWGFYGLYGFLACVLLVLIAKELRKVLMRPEDYYDG